MFGWKLIRKSEFNDMEWEIFNLKWKLRNLTPARCKKTGRFVKRDTD